MNTHILDRISTLPQMRNPAMACLMSYSSPPINAKSWETTLRIDYREIITRCSGPSPKGNISNFAGMAPTCISTTKRGLMQVHNSQRRRWSWTYKWIITP